MKLDWKLVLLTALFTSSIFVIRPGHASASSSTALYVSNPSLVPGEVSPLSSQYTPTIIVEVNSSLPISNVTLYYLDVPFSRGVPGNLSLYSTKMMQQQPTHPSSVNEEYSAQIQNQPNGTTVYGTVKVVTSNGTFAFSQNTQNTVSIFYVQDYPPEINLSVGIAIVDVDSKLLNLNVTTTANLYDTIPYSYFSWNAFDSYSFVRGFLPQLSDHYSGYWWSTNSSEPSFLSVSYAGGDPRRYPFDSYAYSLVITLPPKFNLTSLQIGSQNIEPNKVYSNLTAFAYYAPSSQADLSQWNITTHAEFLPNINGSKISIIFFLTHRQAETIQILMIPVIAMFALLGGSIILWKESDTTNRLAIYLTVIVFSFGFFTGIRNLEVLPAIAGLSVIEELTFSLVPCTVVFAILSMIGNNLGRWRLVSDTIAVLISGYTVYSLTSYPDPSQLSFNFFGVGGVWVYYFVLALLVGFLVRTTQLIIDKIRSRLPLWP
ncbi:MAG: hypothetical protein PXY39_12840 [archaeon]|nr:hypothetical protein [archaeon]